MMPNLKVYLDLMNQPCRALYIFMEMNSIPFDVKTVALRKGEHMTEEYAKVNPFQKVPVIDDNGFLLTESITILRYLCTKYSSQIQPHWYPSGLQQRAKVDEYLEWQHWNTRLHAASVFRTIIIDPRATGQPVDTKKLQRFQAELEKTLDHLENFYLKGQNFFAGNDLTIADLLGICELMQPLAAGIDVTDGRPKLAAWKKRVQSRLEPHFGEAHKILFMIKQKREAKM